MNEEINNILESSEEVLWHGKINSLILHLILFTSVITSFILAAIPLWLGSQSASIYFMNNGGSGIYWLSFFLLIIGLGFSFGRYYYDRLIVYVLTNKRFIIRSGFFGTDFISVYYDQVRNVVVSVDIIQRILGIGTLRVDTGDVKYVDDPAGEGQLQSVYTLIKDIEQPYEVYKIFQSTLSGRKESLYSGRADRETLDKS